MPQPDDPSQPSPGLARGWLDDLRLAAAFLTRLAPPPGGDAGARPLARAARAFPLVGAGLGLGAGAVYWAAAGLGLPPTLGAVCAVAALVWATGALHEDGLGDTADAFGGGGGRDDKLAIMRDSRTGAFGVVALTLSLVARIAALAALAAPGPVVVALVAAGALSRAALPALMLALPPARTDGLAAGAGAPERDDVVLGLGLAGLIALVPLGVVAAAAALVAGGLAALAVARLARRHVGGVTGDVLGAAQQAVEIAVLFALAALQ